MLSDKLEEEEFLTANAQYEIWSPFDAAGAAETLMKMLADLTFVERCNRLVRL